MCHCGFTDLEQEKVDLRDVQEKCDYGTLHLLKRGEPSTQHAMAPKVCSKDGERHNMAIHIPGNIASGNGGGVRILTGKLPSRIAAPLSVI